MRRWSAHIGAVAVAASLLGVATGGRASVPTATVGSRPVAVAVDSVTGTIYVADAGSGTLSVLAASRCNGLATTSCTPVATATIGGSPDAVAVDEVTGAVYIADPSTGTLSVIDGATCDAARHSQCRPVGRVKLGAGLSALAVDEGSGTLYVASSSQDDVAVLSTASCGPTSTSGCASLAFAPVGKAPDGIAVDEPSNTVYVANGRSGTISVLDGSTCDAETESACAPVATGNVASGPDGIAVDENTDTVYVAGQTSSANGGEDYSDAEVSTGLVSVIDGTLCDAVRTTHCSPVANAAVGTTPDGVAVDEGTNTIYVTNTKDTGGPDVSVIDGFTCDGSVRTGCLATWSIPVGAAPTGIAVLPTAAGVPGSVYVADSGAAALSVFGDPGKVTGVTAAPAGPGTASVRWNRAPGLDLPVSTLGAGATPGEFTYRVVPEPRCPTCTGTEVTQPVGAKGALVPDLGTLVTGLRPGVRYRFRVYATNEAGPGPSSASSAGITVNDLRITTPPLGLVAGRRYSEHLRVKGGEVSRWRVLSGRLPSGVHLSASGLLAGVPTRVGTREVTLEATGGAGGHATTAVFSFTVTPGPSRAHTTAPGAPSGLSVTRVSDGQVTLHWKAPHSWGSSSAKDYLVTASRPGTDGTATTTVPASATSAAIGDLYDGFPVSFTVSAVNSAGRSSGPSLPSREVTPLPSTTVSNTLEFSTEPQENGCEQGYLGCFSFQQNFFANAENAGPDGIPFVWGQNVLIFYEENFQWYVQSEAQVWVESSSQYKVFWYGPSDWYSSSKEITKYPSTFTISTTVARNRLVFGNSLAGKSFWSWSAPSLAESNPFDTVETFDPSGSREFFDPQSVLVGYADGSAASFLKPTAGKLGARATLSGGGAESGFDCPVTAAVTSTGETSTGLKFLPGADQTSFSYAKGADEEGIAYGAASYACGRLTGAGGEGRIPLSVLERAARREGGGPVLSPRDRVAAGHGASLEHRADGPPG